MDVGGVNNSSNKEVIVEEWTGSSSTKFSLTATISPSSSSSSISVRRHGNNFGVAWRRFTGAFVPEGFPSSVTPDYLQFQVWDSLQGLSTYVRTMLSTQALLSAIGVGAKSATVIGATFQGSNLDSNAKMWRLVADLMNDLGMLMDLLSPLFPSAFLFIVCLGSLSRSFSKVRYTRTHEHAWSLFLMLFILIISLLKSQLDRKLEICDEIRDVQISISCGPSSITLSDICSIMFVLIQVRSLFLAGVASGATRAALTQHFALQDNAADISAKEGSQETIATMAGMALGMLLARATFGQPFVIWFCFLSLTAFHMYANYRAVKCLSLNTLNGQRSCILLQSYMENGQVLSPNQVSDREHVLPCWTSSRTFLHQRIYLGIKVSSLNSAEMADFFRFAGSYYKKAMYLLLLKKRNVVIVMHKNSSPSDVLEAFIHALVMLEISDKKRSPHSESRSWMDKNYKEFLTKLQLSGWKTERLLSHAVVWRASWKSGISN
ncbi:hypothetical protein V2J09_012936 [Rumex salicifolius]